MNGNLIQEVEHGTSAVNKTLAKKRSGDTTMKRCNDFLVATYSKFHMNLDKHVFKLDYPEIVTRTYRSLGSSFSTLLWKQTKHDQR